MRCLFASALVLLFGLIFCAAAPALPFASRVDVPREMKNQEDLDAPQALDSIIPAQEEVGFPAYPESKILFTQMNNRINDQGKWVDLPKAHIPGNLRLASAGYRVLQEKFIGLEIRRILSRSDLLPEGGRLQPDGRYADSPHCHWAGVPNPSTYALIENHD